MSERRERGFAELLSYIDDSLAFESDYYNEAYMKRRIRARVRRTDADGFGAYERLLRSDEAERRALLDSLSINVTGFFRNPEAWEALRPVLREVCAGPGRTRIWSAACADGREAYSLAMLALDDRSVEADRVSILGTDINEATLAAAREGVYEASTTRNIEAELDPLERSGRYVDREGDVFRVKPAVRELVSFERHDLIRGSPKRAFDLVCCRNLLIYIDPEYKLPIFETITGSLAPSGALMLGMTETVPPACRDAFEPVDRVNRIYRAVS